MVSASPPFSHFQQVHSHYVHNACGNSPHSSATVVPLTAKENDSLCSGATSSTMDMDCDESDSTSTSSSPPAPASAMGEAQCDQYNSYNNMLAAGLAPRLAIIHQEALHILLSPSAEIDDIMAAMKALPNNAEIQALACEKLWVQSWDEENAEELGRTDGIPLVLQAMMRFPSHARLQAGACETLQNVAAANEWNCRAIWQNGGVHLLVHAMMHFPHSAKLQFSGCTTLTSLVTASQDTTSRDFILHAGALTAIMQALQRYRDTESVATAAYEALEALGYDYRI